MRRNVFLYDDYEIIHNPLTKRKICDDQEPVLIKHEYRMLPGSRKLEYSKEFYVHGTVHLSNTSHKNTNEMQLFFSFIWCLNSPCFGRSLRPSSGVL